MAKFSLALFLAATVAAANANTLDDVLGRNLRELKKNKDKTAKSNKSGSKADTSLPTCSSGSSLPSKKGTCAEDTTATCGDSFTGTVYLESSLICNDLSNGEAAITVSGPDAILDCGGNLIFNTGKNSGPGAGVKLVNGATAVNCYVKGFNDGFLMEAGNNLLKSSVAYGNEQGVRTTGEGCMTVEEVMVFGNENDGFQVESSGTIVLSKAKALTNSGSGKAAGMIVRVPKDGSLSLVGEGMKVNGNDVDGILIDSSDADGKTAGSLEAYFTGSTELLGNGQNGIENRNDEAKIVFYDSLIANGNKEGIDAREAEIAFDADSSIVVCGNTKYDFRNSGFVNNSTDVTCDVLKSTDETIVCDSSCPDEGVATVC